MVQFTTAERVFMVEQFNQTNSIAQTRINYQVQFPNGRVPSRKAIRSNVVKYHQHGTSLNRNKGNSGRPRTVRTARNIRDVERNIAQDPRVSSRRNNVPQLSQSSFNRITRQDLRMHPYHVIQRHELLPADLPRRLQFCQWLSNHPERFFSQVIVSDEANFYMNGEVNTRNVHQYAPRRHPPGFYYDIPINRQKLNVWIGLVGDGRIIGPVFIDGNLNGARYLQIINDVVVPFLIQHYGQQRNGAIPRLWWMQDGAPAHRLIRVRDRLHELFPRRVVGLGHAREWPPRSPDLTPLDFFLWGYLKGKVYQTVPANIRELRQRIELEVQALNRTRMVRRSILSMRRRAQDCVALNGGHVEIR